MSSSEAVKHEYIYQYLESEPNSTMFRVEAIVVVIAIHIVIVITA